MNVKEIVIKHLRDIGADGLWYMYKGYKRCGCSIEDLAPCGESSLNCQPAKQHVFNADSECCRACTEYQYGRCCYLNPLIHTGCRSGLCYVPMEEKSCDS